MVRWLAAGTEAALREALRAVAPELSEQPVTIPGPAGSDDPVWHASSAAVGADHIAKFAWSREAAERVAREIGVLTTLRREPALPFLPEIAASSLDPLLLITRRVPGTSLFAVAGTINREQAGRQVACFLAALHHRATRQRATAALGRLPVAGGAAATTAALRGRLGRLIRPGQRQAVARWCDWADTVLAPPPGPAVLAHGDLHGDNQVWDGGELRVVVDFETAGLAEPEYDLRAFPGPGLGPETELLDAIMRHYQRLSSRELSLDRVMAWHLRTALGDVLWRSEAGLPLADHRTPPEWVEDLAARFSALRLSPGAGTAGR